MASDSNDLRLPAELLLQIFKNAAEAKDVDEGAKTLFRLTRVCKLWRSILFDYGSTWSALSLANADVTDIMLQRSKNAPVSLHVDLRSPKRWPGTVARAAYSVLERTVGRVQALVIVGSSDASFNRTVLRGLSHGALNALTTLELTSPKSGRDPAFRIDPTHLSGAVHLRRLTLHKTELLPGAPALLPGLCHPLSHLELREVRGMSLSTLLEMLGAAQGTLETLELSSLHLTEDLAATSPGTIELRVLEELTMHGIETLATSGAAILPFIQHSSTGGIRP
ncbi:unnamed protein product [Peniophora sp. CBMAI 1063]|nr:unnamed protein product [Peniophora sp. CBMAI 1063]